MRRRRRLGPPNQREWDLLTSGKLSTTEKATVHIAQGFAIIERHGGGLPKQRQRPNPSGIDGLTDSSRPN
jgi:hypothetical protein